MKIANPSILDAAAYHEALAAWHEQMKTWLPEHGPMPEKPQEPRGENSSGLGKLYNNEQDYHAAMAAWFREISAWRPGMPTPPKPRRQAGRPQMTPGERSLREAARAAEREARKADRLAQRLAKTGKLQAPASNPRAGYQVIGLGLSPWAESNLRDYKIDQNLDLGEALERLFDLTPDPFELPPSLWVDRERVGTAARVSPAFKKRWESWTEAERRDAAERVIQHHVGPPDAIPVIVMLPPRVVASLDEIRGELERGEALRGALLQALGLGSGEE